jgi:hypothetical protein
MNTKRNVVCLVGRCDDAHILTTQRKISLQHLASPVQPRHLKISLVAYNEAKEDVNTWFSSQATSFYNAGIQELAPRYDNCFNNGGNYVEK